MESKDGRFIKISNFRNIGISEKNEIICINRSTNKNYIGDLVILIGPNNAGKTNVIDAISLLNQNNDFQPTDLPEIISNKNEKTYIKYYTLGQDKKEYTRYYDDDELNNEFLQWKKDVIKKISSFNINYSFNFEKNENNVNIYHDWITTKNKIDSWTLPDLVKLLKKNRTSEFVILQWGGSPFLPAESTNKINNLINKFKEEQKELLNADLPNISKYESWKISNKDFKVAYNEKWNKLFVNLFSKLGIKQTDIINGVQSKQRYYNNIAKKGMQEISNEFNNLFKVKSYIYDFNIFFNDTNINLEINLVKNDPTSSGEEIIPLPYEEQSTGFKYFFDLYFGLLINKEQNLQSGDLILMDEPGSNLHPEGMIELRKILKNYCLTTGISIIFTTHSPFLIDNDFLDEIRIIDRVDGMVNIINNFQFNPEGKSSDSLKSIIKALSTFSNSLIQISHPYFIFVEGITDYNYLTGFKTYLLENLQDKNLIEHIKQLIFIPINGLGKNHTDFAYLDKIIKTDYADKHYKFLIDADTAGNEFQKAYPEQTITLSDLVKNTKEIEDLVDAEDKKTFALEKETNNSATFKLGIIKKHVNAKTITKFQELFTNLITKIFK